MNDQDQKGNETQSEQCQIETLVLTFEPNFYLGSPNNEISVYNYIIAYIHGCLTKVQKGRA